MADEICAVGKGTEEAYVEVIAAFFGGELGAGDDAMPAVGCCGFVDFMGLGRHKGQGRVVWWFKDGWRRDGMSQLKEILKSVWDA